MIIVNFGVGLDHGLEVSIVLKKPLQRLLGEHNPRLVVGVFIRQIDNFEQACVRKDFCRSREVDDAEVIRWLQQEVQA